MAPPPPLAITTGTKSLVAESLLLAQSPERVGLQYTDTAPLTLQGGQSKIQRINMSEVEDTRAIVENHDFENIIETESGRSSSVDYLDTYEDIPKDTVKGLTEETKEKLFKEEKEKETFIENVIKPIETGKKEATLAAPCSTSTVDVDEVARREESGTRIGTTTGTIVDGRNENVPVGEWNSLPLLVERLHAALERSIGGRRDDEPPPPPPPPPPLEDTGVNTRQDHRIGGPMVLALDTCKETELKKDLKFLEDLLLSDIQTALSRLRETLERIDVAALAKHGAASDPTSKLQLLRLVSSLLSRLQLPGEKLPILPSTSLSRRRRGTRHTIGVTAEELAKARKWLEEDRNSLPVQEITSAVKEQREHNVTSGSGHNGIVDRKPEEIRDKCIKDAINQRQLLEDKNKEIKGRDCAFRGLQQQVDVVEEKSGEESSMYRAQYRANNYQDHENNENSREVSEERSRVSKLAAALRQRAELSASGCSKHGAGNKFSAKKSKIKRANTIDIPSYLKLQAESLGRESVGCVSLRKPINVGDRAFSSVNVVPSFQPKTENDRKFLALINRNNETPSIATVVPFKTFGNAKPVDMSSLTNENWNNRFSNIKTSFDKPPGAEDRENNSSLKARANKMFPGAIQETDNSNSSPSYVPQVPKMNTSTGFRHAPSSPFRKIEKSSPGSPSKVPPSYHWPKRAQTPSNTIKEKARLMFDRENTAQPSSKSSRADLEKPSFPRPPWIEHERNENRANGTVTENGKLDYRSFCKQFAPFVGKSSSMEPRKLEENRQSEFSHRDRIPGVVDGKISFKMIPDKRVETHQYPAVECREAKGKFEHLKIGRERGKGGNSFADATLKGSSSVAVQTGIHDEHQDEERSIRVAPKISKGQKLVYNNAAVQTSGELERPVISVSDRESVKQWRPMYCEQSDSDRASEDRQRFVLDHNQNYDNVSSDSEFNGPMITSATRQISSEQSFAEPFRGAHSSQTQAGSASKSYQTKDVNSQGYCSPFVPPIVLNYNQPDEVSDTPQEKVEDWPLQGSSFTDDQNIQNQDISPEVGVVTRYTCAIATVASSVDSPEPRSEEVAMDSRTSSSPSPSQWSWSRSRPPTSETMTSEDEIRRHNLLQQSLVRRLQNEITSLNDQTQVHQTSNVEQHLTVGQNQPKSLSQSPVVQSHRVQDYSQPTSVIQSHRQQNYSQSGNLIKNCQQQNYSQSVNTISSHQPQGYNQPVTTVQPHRQQSSHQPTNTVQQNYNQPANFDQPSNSQGSNRYGKYLTPVPQKKSEVPRTHSPIPVPPNRVGALRDAYELAPNIQVKPIHKERSPVPNGVAPIDSSDEYLVSCANKPSRSIVLSKSESWHQLALTNSYPRAPKVNVPTSTPAFPHSSHPKPPKPRSPSSQKLRSKQYEASSMADSVKKMEDKIRQYFDHPADSVENKDSVKHRRSPRFASKGMIGLSRSHTMPGLSDEKLRLSIPAPLKAPLLNVNTADVDKVFDDLFEEATRTDKQ